MTSRTEEQRRSHYIKTCQKLNLDKESLEDGWQMIQTFVNSKKCSTEEDKNEHAERFWFAAGIWLATQKPRTTAIDGSAVPAGNGISISQIIRSTELKPKDFFNHTKLFLLDDSDSSYAKNLERHEENFAMIEILYRKYDKVLQELFGSTATAEQQHTGWVLFLVVKEDCGDKQNLEVISLYNMLLCAINVLLWRLQPDAHQAVIAKLQAGTEPTGENPFPSLANREEAESQKWDPQHTLKALTEMNKSNIDDVALVLPHLAQAVRKRLLPTELLAGTQPPSGELSEAEMLGFDMTMLNRTYDQMLLQGAGLDERMWLNPEERTGLSTPSKVTPLALRRRVGTEPSPVHRNLASELGREGEGAAPASPVGPKGIPGSMASPVRILNNARNMSTPVYQRRAVAAQTPVTSQLNAVNWLREEMASEAAEPSAELRSYFESCSLGNPEVAIVSRAKILVAMVKFNNDVAESRRSLALRVYYRVLLNMLRAERNNVGVQDFSTLLHNDIFHRSLLAMCLETVIFSYRVVYLSFPFILAHCDLHPFDLSKVILNFVTHERTCPPSLKKHLKDIDESICEELAWQTGSPIFELLPPSAKPSSALTARMKSDQVAAPDESTTTQLFAAHSATKVAVPSSPEASKPGPAPRSPVSGTVSTPALSGTSGAGTSGAGASREFFLRKVLFFAAKRVHELTAELKPKMELGPNVVQQIWETLKYCLIQKTELLQDRHLDQIILCIFYGVTKQCGLDFFFKDLIEAYKKQSQAKPHVYRQVRLGVVLPSSKGDKGDKEVERDSIIQFYNYVFLPEMKQFLLKESYGLQGLGGAPLPSPGTMQPPSPRIGHTVHSSSPLLRRATATGAGGTSMSPTTRSLVAIGESPMQEFAQINKRLRTQRRSYPERLNFDSLGGEDEDDGAGDGPDSKRLKQD